MPLVRRGRIALPLKDMAKMPPTVPAHNLGAAHAERVILMPHDCAGNSIEESWPTTARLELVGCFVERRVACSACVDSGGRQVLVVLAAEWSLGAFFAQDAELLCEKVIRVS